MCIDELDGRGSDLDLKHTDSGSAMTYQTSYTYLHSNFYITRDIIIHVCTYDSEDGLNLSVTEIADEPLDEETLDDKGAFRSLFYLAIYYA